MRSNETKSPHQSKYIDDEGLDYEIEILYAQHRISTSAKIRCNVENQDNTPEDKHNKEKQKA